MQVDLRGKSALITGDLPRAGVRLGVAGKIGSPATAARMIMDGADFVLIGRAAILHHDFPIRARDPGFTPTPLQVSPDYLMDEGLSSAFIKYMDHFPGFVRAA